LWGEFQNRSIGPGSPKSLVLEFRKKPRRTGDTLAFAKGMVLRRDPDREATGRILREALAQLDATPQD